MKFRVFLVCILLVSAPAIAKVFRVNNTLATNVSDGLFKTLQEAHDNNSVSPGDTLMVEGSIIAHPNIDLTKPLVIVGPGYLLDANPKTQANNVQAIMSRITITATASGTVLMGLSFSPNNSNNSPRILANDVIVMRCYLTNNIYLNGELNNIQIVQNYFLSSGVAILSSNDKFSNVVLKNNIIGSVDIASTVPYPRTFSAVENNIFLGEVRVTTSTFQNNVVATIVNNYVTIASANAQYNLFRNATNLIAGTGNQVYSDGTLFAGLTGNSPDGQYKIPESSAFKAAGLGGTEPGVFGGNQPYVLSGIPPFPSIYEIVADGVANKETGLNVKIKVKSNQ